VANVTLLNQQADLIWGKMGVR